MNTSFRIGELLNFLDGCTLTTHTLAHLWDLSLAGGMMKSGAKSLCCLTTYDRIPAGSTARLRDFINQSDAIGVADFADKCLALFDH